MNLLSGQVLVGAALLASPALYQGLVTGTLPIDVALLRYLMVVGFVWVALSVVATPIGPTPTVREVTTETSPPSGSGDDVE